MGEAAAPGAPGADRLAPRLAFFYGAMFGAIGLHLPFWPVWLESERGMDAGTLGLLLAALYWPRIASSALLAWLADRFGRPKRLMVLLALATLVTTALFGLAESFWPLLALSLISGAALSGILPLGEAAALEGSKGGGLHYGRVRLVGSLTFVLAATGGGLAVQARGPALILPLLVAALCLVLLACALMPAGRARPGRGGPGVRRLLRSPGLWPVALAAALIQVSHAVYYGFASIHWRTAGLAESTIGWLWAEAVIAEVVLFAFATGAVARAAPARLLVLAGLLAALRWTLTGLTTELAALLVIQTLHAATFGLTHLATMHHLRDRVPPEALATAQGLFASLTALLFGLVTPAAGWLYGALAGDAFLVVAVLPLAAAAGLARRRRTPPA